MKADKISKTLLKAHGLPELLDYVRHKQSLDDAIYQGIQNTKGISRDNLLGGIIKNSAILILELIIKKASLKIQLKI